MCSCSMNSRTGVECGSTTGRMRGCGVRGSHAALVVPEPQMRLLLLVLAFVVVAGAVSVKLAPHASKCFFTDKLEKGLSIASHPS